MSQTQTIYPPHTHEACIMQVPHLSYTCHTHHTCIIQLSYIFPTDFMHPSYECRTHIQHISYICRMYRTRYGFIGETRPLTYRLYHPQVPRTSLVIVTQNFTSVRAAIHTILAACTRVLGFHRKTYEFTDSRARCARACLFISINRKVKNSL